MDILETYTQQKNRHQKEFNDFKGIFFAFSKDQLNEGMVKVELNREGGQKEIVSIGAGGFLRKDRIDAFHAISARHKDERKNRLKEEKNLIESLVYELQNHEYCITRDPADALNELDLDINTIDKKVLNKALKLAY